MSHQLVQPQWKPPPLKNYSSRSADSLIFTSHGRAALERGAWRLKAVTLLCCIDWERAGVIRLPDSDTWKCRAVILPTTETFIKVCWWNRETRSESERRKPTCLVCRCHRILDSCRNESWQHFAFSFKSQERRAAVNQRRWTVCFGVHYRRAISCQVEGKTTLELLLFNLSVRLYDIKGESKMNVCSPLRTNTNKKRLFYIYIISKCCFICTQWIT